MSRRPVPSVPRARLGLFTAFEAYAAGWTPDALERAVVATRLVRLRRGVYVENGIDDALQPVERARRDRVRRSIAAALTTSRATVTGLSAAVLLGWPVWAPRELACVTVTGGRSTSLAGVHLHRGGVLADAWGEVAGFRITRPSRTVVDIAREFGTEAGLVVADAAVAAGATSAERLRQEIDRLHGRLGIGFARSLPDLVDGRSESVLESRSRWQLVVHDVPPALPRTWIYDLNGHFLGRGDLFWGVGVVGEVDGAGKLAEPGPRKALLERQLRLTRAGLRIVRWGEADLRTFAPTAAWIREELAAAAADPRPARWIASPCRLGPETAVEAFVTAVSDPSRR